MDSLYYLNNKKQNMNKYIKIIITFIVLLIIAFTYFSIWWFNKESFIRFKAEYLTNKDKCDNLNLDDIKKLNEWFKEINYSGWLDYWCNLKSLNFSDLENFHKWNKLKTINIPSSIWKLNNLYEIKLVKVNIKWWIPKEIWNLKNLAILELNGTSIKRIPEEINNLSNLKILYTDKYLYKSFSIKLKEKINNNLIINYWTYIKGYYK